MIFNKTKALIICMAFSGFFSLAYGQDAVPGEFIVCYKNEDSSFQALEKTSSKHNLKLHKAWKKINTYSLKTDFINQNNDAKILKDLRANPNVLFAEPNYYVKAQYLPLTSVDIKAPESWLIEPVDSAAPITVAVLDSGLDVEHPIFKNTGRLWSNIAEINGEDGVDDDGNGKIDDYNGWNFLDNNNNLMDESNHGTHVSGIVVGSTENIFSFSSSTNPRVQIMVLKFLNSAGIGTTSKAIDAIYYAINNGAKIINNSWGGPGYSRALHRTILDTFLKNILFVAAAGNGDKHGGTNNDELPLYPASYDVPNIISVGAIDDFGDLAKFSNFGPIGVDVVAPGFKIISTQPGGGFEFLTGTSMAAPFVSGLAALMVQKSPHFTGYQLKRDIINSVDKLPSLNGLIATEGRVNFEKAVQLAKQNTSEAAFLPEYNLVYSYFSRDLASLASRKEVKGFGCGKVQALYKNYNKNIGKNKFKFSQIFTIVFFLLPFLVVKMARSSFYRRKYKKYSFKVLRNS